MPPKVEPSVNFTREQFEELITRLTAGNREQERSELNPTPIITNAMWGNFSKCTSRFDGQQTADVEAFLDAVITYKECANVSDDNAFRGLPMLLEGIAATWWKGIKSSTIGWDGAVRALREAYSRKLPPPLIYRTMFEREQKGNETTELFVCHIRALLCQLPYELPIIAQLDMVYGLLNRGVRSRLTRDDFDSFPTLLKKARDIEMSQREVMHTPRSESKPLDTTDRKPRVRCTFCKYSGHTEAECRRKAKGSESTSQSKPPKTESVSPAEVKKPQVTCYGCGMPGYIRSTCPTCRPTTNIAPMTSSSFSFNSNVTSSDNKAHRPMIAIKVQGQTGLACLDTGSRGSIAGATLHQLLLTKGYTYNIEQITMQLADGESRLVIAQFFEVDINLNHRIVRTTLVAIPEHPKSKTLLGVDFLKSANIILDITKDEWYFSDTPDNRQKFLKEEPISVESINYVSNETTSLGEKEGKHLDNDQRKQINSLLMEFKDVFASSSQPTPFAEHAIRVTDDTPTAVPPYRMSPDKRKYLETEIERLLEEDIIEECESPYAAPVVLVPKKDGKYRLCVDYRRLNAVTIPDRYPLPRIDDLLHAAKESYFMSTLDLRSGYWQVPVKLEDRDKTAFVTPFGQFRFKRMPFGLRNAPSTFQRLIDRLKMGLKSVLIIAYLDDLMVISTSFEGHVKDLREVFQRLQQFGLHANRSKCSFVCPEIRYLGHVITTQGIKPDPEKIAAISQMPTPRNAKQVRTFLQTGSWFRRFVPGYSGIAKPLSDLTRTKVPWTWGPDQEESFEAFKTLLTSAPILRQADPTKPFVLKTDASSYALGAVLLQGEPPMECPVEYASRLLIGPERNYSTTEREALAVVWAVDKFRGYLEGAEVAIISDHQPLKWLMSLKSPTGRLARWALALQPYNLRIDYTPGRTNVVADTLSRPPNSEEPMPVCGVSITLPTVPAEDTRAKQLEDEELKVIINALEDMNRSVDFVKWTNRGYLMNNGILYRHSPEHNDEEPQLVVPTLQIPDVMYEYHDSPLAGHYGIEKTYHRIASRFYWAGMRKYVQAHVQKCIECQRFKASNLKPSGLLQTPAVSKRFETLSMDLFGPLPVAGSGERWIFIIEDVTTKWVELFALEAATAEACAKCLIDEVILRYGTPRRVISDNGTQFVGDVMQHVAHCLGFKQTLTPAYHPEANPVERRNRDLKTQLAILVQRDHTQWKMNLPFIRFAMNTSRSDATGYTAAYLTFGRELRTPDDVQRDLRAIINSDNFLPQITPHLQRLTETLAAARETQEHQQDASKAQADRRRRSTPPFDTGDQVLVTVHALSKAADAYTAKFAPKRDGPYLVQKQMSPTTYQLAKVNDPRHPIGVYHTSALTPYVPSTDQTRPVRPIRRRGRPRQQPKETVAPPAIADTSRPLRRRGRPPKPSSLVSSPRRQLDTKGEDVTRAATDLHLPKQGDCTAASEENITVREKAE